MRLKIEELGGKLIPLAVGEDHPLHRRIFANWYAATWRAHPTVWQMHVINGQFTTVIIDGKERNGIPATKHCVAQALRAQVLGKLLKLPFPLIHELVAGVLLTDSYKFREWQFMQEVGPSWDSYAETQLLAHLSWAQSEMFSPRVMELAASVAHETLLKMELLCDKYDEGRDLTHFEIAQLIAHFVDDISQDHSWVTEGDGKTNVLTERILVRNASNPTYMTLNQEGRTRLGEEANAAGHPEYFTSGETTYEAQARVGLRVQAVLATFLRGDELAWFNPLDLPVAIDNVLRRRFNREVAVLSNFQHPAFPMRSFTYGGPGWNQAATGRGTAGSC
jgi:hypothetical protein